LQLFLKINKIIVYTHSVYLIINIRGNMVEVAINLKSVYDKILHAAAKRISVYIYFYLLLIKYVFNTDNTFIKRKNALTQILHFESQYD